MLRYAIAFWLRSGFGKLYLVLLTLVWCGIGNAQVNSIELSGNISLEARAFLQSADYPGQEDQNGSVSIEPEFYVDWADGDQRIVFSPFLRYDTSDDERSHADLREFYWRGSFQDVELKVGVAKVFWGVTESQHLVDVINQTDLVENIDTEDKLGQPMVNLSFIKSWGTLELYVLPYFRERTFAGEEGRLRTSLVVDTDHASYEASDEEKHVDFAVRWRHYIGDWDIGLAHFSGTSRAPDLVPSLHAGQLVLIPHYQQIDQTSLDLQATKGDWLWKLELISSRNDQGRYTAFVGGFEYSLLGVLGTASDLGLLLEYHFDARDDKATSPFQNDIFTGVRWVLNDIQSTEVLVGAIVDSDTQATFGNLEASRRLGQSWKISLEARIFSNQDKRDLFFDLRNDDYIEFQISKYF